ncbi:MAG: phosphoenolpyruvate carboxykinase (ATP), partial [Bacteroidetes bacterium]|nr:phosphoenolpyruvate carboxykinase (ATP) [Bacteroidota bacterium]
MVDNNQTTKTISLEPYGIKASKVNYQLTSQQLHDETLAKGQGKEANSGALAVNTGEFTGRSPKDRFIVKDEITEDRVWWGDINIPFDADKFDALYERVTQYLENKEVYVRDSYACADMDYKLNIRVVNEYPWS